MKVGVDGGDVSDSEDLEGVRSGSSSSSSGWWMVEKDGTGVRSLRSG